MTTKEVCQILFEIIGRLTLKNGMKCTIFYLHDDISLKCAKLTNYSETSGFRVQQNLIRATQKIAN